MATVINNPTSDRPETGIGVIVGVVVALAILVIAAVYLVPTLRNNNAGSGGYQTTPGGQIDLNLNASGGSPSGSNGQ